jgi:hypothetical protein
MPSGVAQSRDALNMSAGPGVAVREFTLEKPTSRSDLQLQPAEPSQAGSRVVFP